MKIAPENILEIEKLLREPREEELNSLFSLADSVRKQFVGEEVHLRGLLEISNFCTEQCGYCGIRNANKGVSRYRMSEEEIIRGALNAWEFGYGTMVMQAGEDPGIDAEWLAEIIKQIKSSTGLAVTLSMGERNPHELEMWKQAGADRYLLRFETSDLDLFNHIHGTSLSKHARIELLRVLKELEYETGSGVLVGVPGQTYSVLARDIELFRELDLDMIGIGPYVPHPATPLADELCIKTSENEVPNSELMVYKVLALTRIVCPEANIPSTTALATINTAEGRQNGLNRGANVIMPNVTPQKYRSLYEIYPRKASSNQDELATREVLLTMLKELGRPVGKGYGSRKRTG